VGLSQATQKDGRRHSTATAFLRPAMQRTNLTVETHAHVTRLLIENKRVVGVAYVQNGESREVRVSKEVILSGGAINSPQILLLSGIGPAAHLQEHGISVMVDLPGVGQNLHDHPAASLQYRPLQPLVVPLSSTLGEGNAFVKTRPDVPAPDLQLLLYREEGLYSFVIIGLRPESRGSLTLASADPFAAPRIDPNFLANDSDMQVILDGFKIARKIGEAKALDGYRAAEHQPGAWVQTDEGIRAFIRENTFGVFHPVGTCKMGHDPLAVVNDRLQVHGVQGLRVVDASIMPTIVSGNTNAAVIMIAEKAADMIKQG
jgi:choline dehydrogenase